MDGPPPYSSAEYLPRPQPPPLPPRDRGYSSTSHIPRSKLTSLTDGQRRLLLVFIHGFMGNETSFQRFPAHIHTLMTALVRETYVVHTKIYPRYKSKKQIQHAALDFSAWLEPHEAPTTDVVLLGHSLGGIIAAEVALLPSPTSSGALKHRLLGTLSFDTPFLGMHPGVIKSGLGSLFRPAPASPPATPGSPDGASPGPRAPADITPTSTIASIASIASALSNNYPLDPNYNPVFPNDIRLPTRTAWSSLSHFVGKHSQDLRQATVALIESHAEFGGCMADFEGLKERYARIRVLEEEDGKIRKRAVDSERSPKRVRFANYYTISAGYPKKKKTPKPDAAAANGAELQGSISNLSLSKEVSGADSVDSHETIPSSGGDGTRSPPQLVVSPAEALESKTGAKSEVEDGNSDNDDSHSFHSMQSLDPMPIDNTPSPSDTDTDTETALTPQSPTPPSTNNTRSTSNLPLPTPTPTPILSPSPTSSPSSQSSFQFSPQTPLPQPPLPPDISSLNKTDYKRAMKAYEDALKDYRHILKAIRKDEEQRLKVVRKDEELHARAEAKRVEAEAKRMKEEAKRVKKDMEARGLGASLGSMSTLDPVAANDSGTSLDPALSPTPTNNPSSLHLSRTESKTDTSATKADSKNSKDAVKAAAKAAPKAAAKAQKDSLKELRKAEQARLKAEAKEVKKDVKAQAKLLKEREKAEAKIAKQEAKEHEAEEQAQAQARSQTQGMGNMEDRKVKKEKTKEGKFCVLPPKDGDGNRDPCWIKVFMEGTDEVGAHCGLFFPLGSGETRMADVEPTSFNREMRQGGDQAGEGQEGDGTRNGNGEDMAKGEGPAWGKRYAFLVEDVCERIKGWAEEAAVARER